MGKAKGQSPAHKNFPDQMAKKTVLSRAVKLIIDTSDDSALSLADIKPLELREVEDQSEAQVIAEIKQNANVQEIGFETTTVEFEPETPEEQPVMGQMAAPDPTLFKPRTR
jgi:recombination protein RecT